MLTYNDFLECKTEQERTDFILQAISEHESSPEYRLGVDAGKFYRGIDPDMEAMKKIYYDFAGIAHDDTFSPNHKLMANFHYIFTVQMVNYLLGNGIIFDNPEINKRLGNDFSLKVKKILTWAANDGIAYGLVTKKGIEPFNFACDNRQPNFIALLDEFDGNIKAGIRYWRLVPDKPIMVTLYEKDGFTDYKGYTEKDGEGNTLRRLVIYHEKKQYDSIGISNDVEGVYNTFGTEYSEIPIIPLPYINRQSSLVGKRETLVAYDIMLSGLVNEVADFNLLYWVIKNAGGMDEYEDKKLLINILKRKMVHVDNDQEVTPVQVNTNHEAIEAVLDRLKKQLVLDYMAADYERISSGSVTTVEINAAFELLDKKCDEVEEGIYSFIHGVLRVLGYDENEVFHLKRGKELNKNEEIQGIISSAPWLGEEMTTKLLCEVHGIVDEYENVEEQKATESMNRFNDNNNQSNEETETGQESEE